MTGIQDDLATSPPLPDEIVVAIARVATNGTIVCSCCNASDATDDDHRAGCPVWGLRYAIARELARVEAEITRLEAIRLPYTLREAWQRAETLEAEIARLERRLESAERWKRSYAAGRAGLVEQADQDYARAEAAESEVARLKDGLREIEELCSHWELHDKTDPDEHERWRKAAEARAKMIGDHARALLADDGAAPKCSLCDVPLASGDCTHVLKRGGQVTMTEASWERLVGELNDLRGRQALSEDGAA